MFRIEFIDEAVSKEVLDSVGQAVYAHMTIKGVDDFDERIIVHTDYWKRDNYLEQWLDAIQSLANPAKPNEAALITIMNDPMGNDATIEWWPLYLRDGTVYMQSGYLPLSEHNLTKDFSFPKLYAATLPYDEPLPDEEGHTISEWVIPFQDLLDWSEALKAQLQNK